MCIPVEPSFGVFLHCCSALQPSWPKTLIFSCLWHHSEVPMCFPPCPPSPLWSYLVAKMNNVLLSFVAARQSLPSHGQQWTSNESKSFISYVYVLAWVPFTESLHPLVRGDSHTCLITYICSSTIFLYKAPLKPLITTIQLPPIGCSQVWHLYPCRLIYWLINYLK
jgi:hypothetical protein